MIKINPKDIRPNTVDYEEFGFLDGVRSSIQTQIDIALLPDGTIPLSAKWSTAFNIIVNKNGGEITADEGDFTNTYLNCFQLATNSVFGNGFLNLISIEEYDSTDVFYFLLDADAGNNKVVGWKLKPLSGSANTFLYLYGHSVEGSAYGSVFSVRQKAGDSEFGNVVLDTISPGAGGGNVYVRTDATIRLVLDANPTVGDAVIINTHASSTARALTCVLGSTEKWGLHNGGGISVCNNFTAGKEISCGSGGAGNYRVGAGTLGVSSTFTSKDLKTVTILRGIITGIV